ncbi:unnamed protein product [Euphydryas editha]|uniref:Uncharacterized protein n=1 Tax=Euphydryas editha TaxID=104508 RepID=A0AAU9UKN7_EUPED|nr:unnamed protein product [Euphydryas editha]
MSNLEEKNIVERKNNIKENEKEMVIDIEENLNVLNTTTGTETLEETDKNIKDVDQKTLEKEEKFENVECGKNFEYDIERKPPEIWIQYNQAYGQGQEGKGYGHHPHHNYDTGNYGGASLDYDPETRNFFIKWVFMILLIMLAITAAIAIIILAIPEVKSFYQRYGLFLMIASMIILVGMNYVMACCAIARVPPCNFISLVIVVLAMSNMVGAVTCKYKTHILIFAVLATVVTVAVCVLLACSRFDFTKWYLYVVAIAVAFLTISAMVSIAMLVMNMRFKPLQIAMLFIGGLLSVVVLVMELQMILGGKTIEMSEDDYALGAYLLYTSIVDIFLKYVQLMGLFDE